MASYREKVSADLDRWIAQGLVNADKREAILATLPQARRLDAATALAWVGALLLGVAVIAFVAANWDALSRFARFAILIAAFLVAACGGAWASRAERPILTNILLMVASLIFAASIGLTGQIFDIAGEPRDAQHAAGVAALALALAGRSTGAAIVGLAFIALGDFDGAGWFGNADSDVPWMLVAAPLGAFLALRWSSAPLAHASALAIIYCFAWFAGRADDDAAIHFFLSIALGAMAAAARWLGAQDRAFATVFYGWFTAGALIFFAIAGYVPMFGDGANAGLVHRVIWIAASGGVIALGRFDRHALVTAIGVISLLIAIFATLSDLGLDLMAAAGVFLVCAVIALIAGLALRRRKADA